MLCASDVDVSKQRIYFALKTETASELRSLTLSSSEDFFDSSVERRVDDEFMNGLFACRPITLLLLPRRVRSTAISVFVCMSVCLYLFARISQTACPKFRKFFLHTSGFAVSAVSLQRSRLRRSIPLQLGRLLGCLFALDSAAAAAAVLTSA